MIRDSKKRFLRCQTNVDVIPHPTILYGYTRNLIHSARRQDLISRDCDLRCDRETGTFDLISLNCT